MFKITGITLIVIKGSVVQGAECSQITMCLTGIDFNTSSEPSELYD